MAILEVKDLAIRFGGIQALKGVSFSVEPNSFVGLMGPNGAGKTTVINCLSHVYKPEKGEAIFEGVNLFNLSSHEVAEMGIARTFQDLGFFNHISDMSVMDYLKLGQLGTSPKTMFWDGAGIGRSREELARKKRVREILEFFREMREELEPVQEERGYPILFGRGGAPDLLDVEEAPIASLSFAWRRRLDLARALISRPKLLILDEPAQGLSPSEMENLGNILNRVREEFGLSALIVEHNVAMLMKVSSKIIAMSQGEIIASGTPQEINAHPKVNEIYLGQSELPGSKNSHIERAPLKRKGGEPVLDVRKIELYYGQARALSSISMKLYPGEIACVLGSNGSGKSSLLKAISGLAKPRDGEMVLGGEFLPLGWPELAVERGVQYVPQGHALFPQLSVLQNLKLGAHAFEKRGEKADLDRVFHYFPELKNVLSSQANDLSGGQRQMVAIGQAIIGKPKLLLLDEPSLGLSPRYVDTLFGIIRQICREEGCSIVLVEHNVAKSLEISDYVFMLSSGVLIAEGTSKSFRDDMSLVKKNLGFL